MTVVDHGPWWIHEDMVMRNPGVHGFSTAMLTPAFVCRQRQTKDFGHIEADKYSCLIFDNRGMGESDKPLLRYTTSEMAKDVVELLNHVGWTEDRSVHVVGISMGGMISQELVWCVIPGLFGPLLT